MQVYKGADAWWTEVGCWAWVWCCYGDGCKPDCECDVHDVVGCKGDPVYVKVWVVLNVEGYKAKSKVLFCEPACFGSVLDGCDCVSISSLYSATERKSKKSAQSKLKRIESVSPYPAEFSSMGVFAVAYAAHGEGVLHCARSAFTYGVRGWSHCACVA